MPQTHGIEWLLLNTSFIQANTKSVNNRMQRNSKTPVTALRLWVIARILMLQMLSSVYLNTKDSLIR